MPPGDDGQQRQRRDPREEREPQAEAPFICGHCGRRVPPLPSGGRHRNHCPSCLYSRHVDAHTTGDRASACSALMEPIGTFQRRNGEYVVVHRCLGCGFERFNRIAADDDLPLALSLPALPPRQAEGAPAGARADAPARSAHAPGARPTHANRTNKPSRRERQMAQLAARQNQPPNYGVEPGDASHVVLDGVVDQDE